MRCPVQMEIGSRPPDPGGRGAGGGHLCPAVISHPERVEESDVPPPPLTTEKADARNQRALQAEGEPLVVQKFQLLVHPCNARDRTPAGILVGKAR